MVTMALMLPDSLLYLPNSFTASLNLVILTSVKHLWVLITLARQKKKKDSSHMIGLQQFLPSDHKNGGNFPSIILFITGKDHSAIPLSRPSIGMSAPARAPLVCTYIIKGSQE